MHEGDEDLEKYKSWLDECFDLDESFTLEVGESCRVRDSHVENLPNTNNNSFCYGDGRFKLMYKRVDEDTYQWLDTEGNQGSDRGPLAFYVKYWEKI